MSVSSWDFASSSWGPAGWTDVPCGKGGWAWASRWGSGCPPQDRMFPWLLRAVGRGSHPPGQRSTRASTPAGAACAEGPRVGPRVPAGQLRGLSCSESACSSSARARGPSSSVSQGWGVQAWWPRQAPSAGGSSGATMKPPLRDTGPPCPGGPLSLPRSGDPQASLQVTQGGPDSTLNGTWPGPCPGPCLSRAAASFGRSPWRSGPALELTAGRVQAAPPGRPPRSAVCVWGLHGGESG